MLWSMMIDDVLWKEAAIAFDEVLNLAHQILMMFGVRLTDQFNFGVRLALVTMTRPI